MTQQKHVSPQTALTIDIEIRTIIDRNYQRAKDILKKHKKELDAMASALMKYETIDRTQIIDIMEGRVPNPPEGWEDKSQKKAPATKKAKTKKNSSPPVIGGPASEH